MTNADPGLTSCPFLLHGADARSLWIRQSIEQVVSQRTMCGHQTTLSGDWAAFCVRCTENGVWVLEIPIVFFFFLSQKCHPLSEKRPSASHTLCLPSLKEAEQNTRSNYSVVIALWHACRCRESGAEERAALRASICTAVMFTAYLYSSRLLEGASEPEEKHVAVNPFA